MKEIRFKFESEKDYQRMLSEIIDPLVKENKIEYDASNDIVIIKKKINENIESNMS